MSTMNAISDSQRTSAASITHPAWAQASVKASVPASEALETKQRNKNKEGEQHDMSSPPTKSSLFSLLLLLLLLLLLFSSLV